jgi:hypothetical protein
MITGDHHDPSHSGAAQTLDGTCGVDANRIL